MHCRYPRQHPTTQFFTGRMPFLPTNQQRQSTEGTKTLVVRRNMEENNKSAGYLRFCTDSCTEAVVTVVTAWPRTPPPLCDAAAGSCGSAAALVGVCVGSRWGDEQADVVGDGGASAAGGSSATVDVISAQSSGEEPRRRSTPGAGPAAPPDTALGDRASCRSVTAGGWPTGLAAGGTARADPGDLWASWRSTTKGRDGMVETRTTASPARSSISVVPPRPPPAPWSTRTCQSHAQVD